MSKSGNRTQGRSSSSGRRQQLGMVFRTRGGKRRGAGRKAVTVRGGQIRAGVSHRRRPAHKSSIPVHITLRLDDAALACVRTLRQRACYNVLHRAFLHGCVRETQSSTQSNKATGSFRIVHYSVQRTHIHMIVEASTRQALSRGIQSFSIRAAKGLNRVFARKGRVFGDRYHEQPLTNPSQVRNTILYVLNNARRHGEHRDVPQHAQHTWMDPYSSARYFDGWRLPHALEYSPPESPCPVAPASTWLLGAGWRKHGLITISAVPTAARA